MGLLDTYTGLVIIYLALGLPLVIWVLFGYFDTMPREIDEAAAIDGVTHRSASWSHHPPDVAARDRHHRAARLHRGLERVHVRTGLHLDHRAPDHPGRHRQLHRTSTYVPWGDIAAASIVVTVPLIVLVLIFQRHIIDGLTQGAVKE